MELHVLFSRPFRVRYRAGILTDAFLFWFLVNLFRWVVPLVLVWRSEGFWLKETTYREMPDVDFMRHMILVVESREQTLGFSTFAHLDRAFKDSDRWAPLSVKDFEIDHDGDQKLDQLNLQLEIPLDLNQHQIYSYRLILFLRYHLKEHMDLRMETVAELSHSSHRPGQRSRVKADLNLVQRVPLFHKGFDYRYNQSLILLPRHKFDFDEHPFILENFLHAYYSRDYFTRVTPTILYWDPYLPAANTNFTSFRIDITLHYRDQVFRFWTGFWYLIKWALVQYLAVWVVIDCVVRAIERYTYENFLVTTVPEVTNLRHLKQALKSE